jgi:P2-related tail formation protein
MQEWRLGQHREVTVISKWVTCDASIAKTSNKRAKDSVGVRSTVRILTLVCLYISDVASHDASSYGILSDPVTFRIAAQPINQALKEFALQSHLQLIFVTDEVSRTRSAHEVIGVYAPQVALAKLLADTCIRYKFVNANTIALEVSHSGCR